ncbi:MAG TPA: hypothetical protein VN833_19665 [Candidatus Acidoferrales bacterium]|nr:hypothetical protein [Candidatus Acidoferrales bacterium]
MPPFRRTCRAEKPAVSTGVYAGEFKGGLRNGRGMVLICGGGYYGVFRDHRYVGTSPLTGEWRNTVRDLRDAGWEDRKRAWIRPAAATMPPTR